MNEVISARLVSLHYQLLLLLWFRLLLLLLLEKANTRTGENNTCNSLYLNS